MSNWFCLLHVFCLPVILGTICFRAFVMIDRVKAVPGFRRNRLVTLKPLVILLSTKNLNQTFVKIKLNRVIVRFLSGFWFNNDNTPAFKWSSNDRYKALSNGCNSCVVLDGKQYKLTIKFRNTEQLIKKMQRYVEWIYNVIKGPIQMTSCLVKHQKALFCNLTIGKIVRNFLETSSCNRRQEKQNFEILIFRRRKT